MTIRLARALTIALLLSPAVAGAQTVDLDAATIQQLSAAMDAGTVTSEKLVQLSLARIDAYDDKGPLLNAVLTRNAKALEQARALDAERKAKGKRSLLHGIPVVLKDNFDTFDLPTTGGSILLEGSVPPDDAFVVKKLREAGVADDGITLVTVPGALEIPLAAQRFAQTGDYDALVALGCVIRGETYHFEIVSNESAAGLANVQLEFGFPIGNGILTTETDEQALARAGTKGAEAAQAALELANLLDAIDED